MDGFGQECEFKLGKVYLVGMWVGWRVGTLVGCDEGCRDGCPSGEKYLKR